MIRQRLRTARTGVMNAPVIAVFLLGIAGCQQADSDIGTVQSAPQPSASVAVVPETHAVPKIVAFGDSLTAGAGIPATEAYPAQLQRRLTRAGYNVRVINAGVSGETTAGGLRRVDWVLKSHPDIVILELGANDGLRGLPIGSIQSNLERIIERLQAGGVTVVLTGMKLPLNYGEEYRARFEAVYTALAEKYRLPFMPFFLEGVGAQAALNQADGIHPTAEGYRVIVDHLWPILESVLKKRILLGRVG